MLLHPHEPPFMFHVAANVFFVFATIAGTMLAIYFIGVIARTILFDMAATARRLKRMRGNDD